MLVLGRREQAVVREIQDHRTRIPGCRESPGPQSSYRNWDVEPCSLSPYVVDAATTDAGEVPPRMASLVQLFSVSSPKWTLNSVRSYAGLSITTASFSEGSAVPAGRFLTRTGSSGPARPAETGSRPAMVPKTRSIRAPGAKIRFRLYSAWPSGCPLGGYLLPGSPRRRPAAGDVRRGRAGRARLWAAEAIASAACAPPARPRPGRRTSRCYSAGKHAELACRLDQPMRAVARQSHQSVAPTACVDASAALRDFRM
jgi:hypothetical protein